MCGICKKPINIGEETMKVREGGDKYTVDAHVICFEREKNHSEDSPQIWIQASQVMKHNDLDNKFTHHPPKNDQTGRYEEIRNQGKSFAKAIAEHCPNSREKSLAMTKIEEAVMWANASIARNE